MPSELLSTNGLIHSEDLYYMLGVNDDIRLLDATYGLPGTAQSPFQAYLGRHIEGAQFFDIDVVADQQHPLPHMAPSEEYFAACASALGIGNKDHVVVYDQSNCYMASSRAWWLFRLFGHDRVYVLEGGLHSWMARGFPVADGAPEQPAPASFIAKKRPEFIVDRTDLMTNLETRETIVVDARPAARFTGDAPEPRPGMRAGHIPASYNLPFIAVLDGGSGLFKDDDVILSVAANAGIDHTQPIAVTCGSGVTACTVALGLYKAAGTNAAIYDASWSEWGDELAGTPIEVSA